MMEVRSEEGDLLGLLNDKNKLFHVHDKTWRGAFIARSGTVQVDFELSKIGDSVVLIAKHPFTLRQLPNIYCFTAAAPAPSKSRLPDQSRQSSHSAGES